MPWPFWECLWNCTERSGREEGQGSALESWPEIILEFRRKRLSTSVQPLGLEMSNIWLGEKLHARDEKEVIKKESETEDVAEHVNHFDISYGEREV